jgi:hypothetical protein
MEIHPHLSPLELLELINTADRVCDGKSGKNTAIVMLKQKPANLVMFLTIDIRAFRFGFLRVQAFDCLMHISDH